MGSTQTDERKSRAIVTYVWSGSEPHPCTNERAVLDEFGEPDGAELLSYADAVVMEMNQVTIDWSVHTLDSATDMYAADVRRRHPELTEAAVEMLRRAFSYWYK